MEKLILIEVPSDSTNHYINNVGCLRYNETPQVSSVIEPMQSGVYLDKNNHIILGFSNILDKKYIVVKNK